MTPYDQLDARFARLGSIHEAIAVLKWDYAAIMPAGGIEARQSQLSTLEVVCHELLTHPALGDALPAAEAQRELDPWQRANLGEMRRRWLHAAAIPVELVEARCKANLACEMIWRLARPSNDFARVKPALQHVLDLTREMAQAKADRLGKSPYDALLDEYEPDGSSAEIDRLFDQLMRFLPDTIAAIIERQASRPSPLAPEGPFPIDRQKQVGLKLMAALGFDFDHGRLDASAHPFCGGTPDDVRITTRYREDDFGRALMGVLHETGHALYERGLPANWRRQPVGRARSMSIHESQSLLIEMQACRSREFLEFLAPILRDTFGGRGAAWEPENLYRWNTRVERSLIRVDADEATYPAHVILRYRLEKALIAGDLTLDELPGAWRDGMRALVGIVPLDDRDGVLQDIHWYQGLFGYFSTYTLGAMTAAQLFQSATAGQKVILPAIATGDFRPLLGWLRHHVHARASSVPAARIVADATGNVLDVTIFERHLATRYLRDT
jgi:carboxypeptidase Taq